MDPQQPKALGCVMPQLRGDLVNATPLAPPHHVPRALKLTHPVFALALNHLRQLHGENAIVEGIVSRGEMPLLLELLDDLYHYRGALLIGEAMLEVMEYLQEAGAHVLH